MAKQPTIETILSGYAEKSRLNKNFIAIVEKFDEMLSRDTTTDTPNFMEVDFDIADANITNVNRLEVRSLQVVDVPVPGLSDFYVYKLGLLGCDTEGDIITHDAQGDPVCLSIGSDGQVLKSGSARPVWTADTDTDTIGVTIQEDGVTVAENVTNIDFTWTPTDIVSTPAGNQVDLQLTDFLAPLYEDQSQSLSNVGNEAAPAHTDNTRVGRHDLISDVGLDAVPTEDNQYYVMVEIASWIEGPAAGAAMSGSWTLSVVFYDSTGTSTPITGNVLTVPPGEANAAGSSTAGGNTFTVVCGIPANTRYIDASLGLAPLFPLNVQYENYEDRYTAVFTPNLNGVWESPNGNSVGGTTASTADNN